MTSATLSRIGTVLVRIDNVAVSPPTPTRRFIHPLYHLTVTASLANAIDASPLTCRYRRCDLSVLVQHVLVVSDRRRLTNQRPPSIDQSGPAELRNVASSHFIGAGRPTFQQPRPRHPGAWDYLSARRLWHAGNKGITTSLQRPASSSPRAAVIMAQSHIRIPAGDPDDLLSSPRRSAQHMATTTLRVEGMT